MLTTKLMLVGRLLGVDFDPTRSRSIVRMLLYWPRCSDHSGPILIATNFMSEEAAWRNALEVFPRRIAGAGCFTGIAWVHNNEIDSWQSRRYDFVTPEDLRPTMTSVFTGER